MKTRIAAAVSGGVDSLMAACLLEEQGFSIVGLHFVTGYEPGSPKHARPEANLRATGEIRRLLEEAEERMKTLSSMLGIPIHVLDLSEEFEKCVVDNFVRTYRDGKTPNPCLVCNPSIKFGALLQHAKKLGASKVATGHYARVEQGSDGKFRLLKGTDSAKDQSYFLGFMNQDQLGVACFPLGDKTKSDVKLLAKERGLVPVTKGESQDVCFVSEESYGGFLSRNFSPEPGEIADTSGKTIGEHKGLHLFTVGQRRGINCPASEPYYVVRIDSENNRLVVGFKHELLQTECRVESINWIREIPEAPFVACTKVRYRSAATESEVVPEGKMSALVRFRSPREALTPGQGAVFYMGEEVTGAGWIAKGND